MRPLAAPGPFARRSPAWRWNTPDLRARNLRLAKLSAFFTLLSRDGRGLSELSGLHLDTKAGSSSWPAAVGVTGLAGGALALSLELVEDRGVAGCGPW